eukprot:g4505.t1
MSSVLFAQDSSLLGVSASEVLAAPQKQSLRDVEREIDARLHEIAELESELLLTTELELLQEEEVRVRSKQATIAEEDDAVSLLSMKKRPEDARWRYLQQCVDPTERCRALLLHSHTMSDELAFEVSSREVGRIIGTKGCNIRTLELGSQCRIKTPGKKPEAGAQNNFGQAPQNSEYNDDPDKDMVTIRITGGNEKLRARCKEAIDAVLMGSDPGDVFAELDGAGLIRNLDPVVLNYLGKEKARFEEELGVRLELEAKSLRIWDKSVFMLSGGDQGGSSSSSAGKKGRGRGLGNKNKSANSAGGKAKANADGNTSYRNGGDSTAPPSKTVEDAKAAIQEAIDELQTSDTVVVRVPAQRVNQIINHSSLRQLQDSSHIQCMVTKDDEGTGIRLIGLRGAIEEGRTCIEKLMQGEGADFLALYPGLLANMGKQMERDFKRDVHSLAGYCKVAVSVEPSRVNFAEADEDSVEYAKAETMKILQYYFPQCCARLDIEYDSVDYVAGEEDRNLMRLQQMGATVTLDRNHAYVWVTAQHGRNVDAVRKRIDDLQTSWKELFQVIKVRHQGDFGRLFSQHGNSVRGIQSETGTKVDVDRNRMEIRITGHAKASVESAKQQLLVKMQYDGNSMGSGRINDEGAGNSKGGTGKDKRDGWSGSAPKENKRVKTEEIVPRVYLGPYEAAKNEEHLRNLGISHCIIFRSPEESRIIKKKFEQWIQYEVIECSDTANQNLIPLFPMVKEAVDKVMETYDLPWDASVHYVSTRRNCVSLNENFRLQLREYEAIWKTRKRQMEEAMNPNEAGNNVSVFSPQANVGIRNGAGVVNVNVNPVPGFGMPAVTGLQDHEVQADEAGDICTEAGEVVFQSAAASSASGTGSGESGSASSSYDPRDHAKPHPDAAKAISGGGGAAAATKQKFKVSLGVPRHTCSCGGGTSKFKCATSSSDRTTWCVHICFVLLKVLRVGRDFATVSQDRITEAELEQLLSYQERQKQKRFVEQQKQQRREEMMSKFRANLENAGVDLAAGSGSGGGSSFAFKPPDADDQCPICFDDLLDDKTDKNSLSLVYCADGCRQAIHTACMYKWCEHHGRSGSSDNTTGATCPLCRVSWSKEQIALLGKRYQRSIRKRKEAHAGFGCVFCKTKPIRGALFAALGAGGPSGGGGGSGVSSAGSGFAGGRALLRQAGLGIVQGTGHATLSAISAHQPASDEASNMIATYCEDCFYNPVARAATSGKPFVKKAQADSSDLELVCLPVSTTPQLRQPQPVTVGGQNVHPPGSQHMAGQNASLVLLQEVVAANPELQSMDDVPLSVMLALGHEVAQRRQTRGSGTTVAPEPIVTTMDGAILHALAIEARDAQTTQRKSGTRIEVTGSRKKECVFCTSSSSTNAEPADVLLPRCGHWAHRSCVSGAYKCPACDTFLLRSLDALLRKKVKPDEQALAKGGGGSADLGAALLLPGSSDALCLQGSGDGLAIVGRLRRQVRRMRRIVRSKGLSEISQ